MFKSRKTAGIINTIFWKAIPLTTQAKKILKQRFLLHFAAFLKICMHSRSKTTWMHYQALPSIAHKIMGNMTREWQCHSQT